MEKENDQEVKWIEAQKIEISVDLFAAAKQQLQFLAAVDRNRWLYDGPQLKQAIYRYNACWLPLLAKYSDSVCEEGPLVPPLDCEWIWHCHRLNPVRYKSDCEQFYGRVLDNSGVVSSVNGGNCCKLKTEDLWKRLYPEEPYELDLNNIDISTKSSALEKCTKYDLVAAVHRQSSFYYQVSRSHVKNDIFLQEAVARYKGFLYLIKKNKKGFCVPTYDVDLIWHTHQLHPFSYCHDMEKLIGKVLDHDDTDSDRGKGKKLDTGFSKTTAQWEETFGTRYWKAGAMRRGNPPTPVTTSPFASSDVLVKEPPIGRENLIHLQEVESVEVFLEIIGIRNLPDEEHKGKLSVLFSKTQPDSLFNAERRLTILSEVGEKQVAKFQCEPTGELVFKIISTSSLVSSREPTKTLGFGSLSLKEFLFPFITQLSVEKWLEITPSKGSKKADQKPISLRVAVSFTPPMRIPSVIRMVQSTPLCKGSSCFFPVRGLAKSLAHIFYEETQTEVVRLQMRSPASGGTLKDGQRQVIGETDSGETHVLGDYTGSFWSLLDSKWSLKQTNSSTEDDKPVFELLGPRVVKLFSGRKLDYEPTTHCENLRSDQDFMTFVEFSIQHPYGNAVGLVDRRFGFIETKENWLVLPGIVSAFLLNTTLLKNGRFDNVFSTTKSNASGCGSGCGGGCGYMVNTAADASGCSGNCNGECHGNCHGEMVNTAADASGCSGNCNGECHGNCHGEMMNSAADASGCSGNCNGECHGNCHGEMVNTAADAGGCSGDSHGDMVKAA